MCSVTVIARDAAKTLGKCLDSVRDLTDDIVVVVDERTTDNTAEIAKKFTPKVFIHKFENYSQQKNYAASLAKSDWILSLDVDEELPPRLRHELMTINYEPSAAFAIPRRNIIFGKLIRHTNWDPNPIVRLYNRQLCHWEGDIHEQIKVFGPVERLKNCIIHHNYSSVEEFIDRLNRYTTLETTPANPFYEFFRRYIWHVGFLDGWHGLFLSYLMAIYHTSIWVKLWQKTKRLL